MSVNWVKGLKITFILTSLVGAAGQAWISSVENRMILTDLVNKTVTK